MIDLQKKQRNGTLEVSLEGRLDAASADYVESELEEVIRGGKHVVTLDLAGVPFISSAGLRVLLRAHQALRAVGGTLAIARTSPFVASVLRLTGLASMLDECTAPVTGVAADGPRVSVVDGVELVDHGGSATAPLAARLVGDPAALVSGLGAGDPHAVSLPADALAVGLGALGESDAACRDRAGELLSVAGCTAYLPSDGSKRPDYMIASGDLVPRAYVLYAAVCRGVLDRCVRFEALDEPVALSGLAAAALSLVGGGIAAVVIVAESAGLVGASLRRSPAAEGLTFSHPDVRSWLTFTPEPAYPRSLALIAGLAAAEDPGPLAPLLRPLGTNPRLLGHLHAAVLTFRALSRGRLALRDTVASLFSEQKALGLLHLLDDNRELAGAGESRLLRGAMWVAPVVPEPVAGRGCAGGEDR